MKHRKALKKLLSHLKQTAALSQVAGLISWDQETMMPPEGGPARAEQSAAMAAIIHQREANLQVGDWCAAIDTEKLDRVDKANVREAMRSHRIATRIPQKLAEELARQAALGQSIWADARAKESVADFLPTLEKMVALKRQEARCLSSNDDDLYDTLLDEFEPGMTTSDLGQLFSSLRPGLIALREKIATCAFQPSNLSGSFSEQDQMELARRLATIFNYRWQAGRIDKAVHPFSSGYRSDSRITTRVNPANIFDCLYSTIHEVGHANYEQGRDPSMDRLPAGGYASMGVHESQSRMLENQIGRSRAFMDWLHPQMRDVLGEYGLASPQQLFAAINRVQPGFIRTEADEVHYNLHIMMRFDLERALILGDLQTGDLEAAWNDRFLADFGVAVDMPSNGLLQDVHWSCGLFGYFPTYSLGNIYAGELFAAMDREIPDIESLIAKGELAPLSNWLRVNIHEKGFVHSAPELLRKVLGKKPDTKALLAYLEQKFERLYQI